MVASAKPRTSTASAGTGTALPTIGGEKLVCRLALQGKQEATTPGPERVKQSLHTNSQLHTHTQTPALPVRTQHRLRTRMGEGTLAERITCA